MGLIALVTDSTAYLPPDLVARYGITVVPLYLNFGEESYRDGVDITPGQFYARLAAATAMPTTSQPPAGDFVEAYRRLIEGGAKAILSVLLSSKLSGTVASAMMAREEFPEVPIHIVDSLSTSMGLGFLVLEAARMLEAGRPLDEVVNALELLRELVRILFVVDTLEFLHRGGRIGGAQAFLGSLLNLKPLLAVRDGRVEAVERVRTKRRAVQRMMDMLSEQMGDQPVRVAVLHSVAPEEGKALRQEAEARLNVREIYTIDLSPAIGTHAGPGTVGIVICPVVEG